jgi:predicted amidohydrolase YtcJ
MNTAFQKSLIFGLMFGMGTLLAVSLHIARDKQNNDTSLGADTVLVNGKLITVDPSDSIVEAAAIKDGKILALGRNAEINKLIGRNTQVIDLKGLTATPGLIDSHCHFDGTGLLFDLDLNYPKVKKIADMVELVKQKVETLKPGEWIVGAGWDEGKLEELRYVYAKDIDPVTPNNPGWFAPGMGHYGLANSSALKLAKVTRETPDPAGGTIDRYPDGTPTGILKESAMGLVTRLIPPYSEDQRRAGTVRLIEEFNKAGMTAAKDGGIALPKWKLYQDLLAEDKLNVRMFVLWRAGRTIEQLQNVIERVGPFTKPYLSTGDDRLVSGGIKIVLDGSGGGRTAWVYNEWNKNFTDVDKGNYGYPALDPELFRKMFLLCHNAGLHVAVHAIGDKAIDWLVDTYVLAFREKPISHLRHSIIHCNIPTDHAIDLIAEMQKNFDAATIETQSPFMWDIGDAYAGNFGPARCLRFMPFKTYREKGIIWGGGSDWDVTPFEGKYGIWATITRSPLKGSYGLHPYGTAQSVDVRTALRSYTIWNARQLFLENKIGSLEVGKYADIAIWDKDLYTIPTDEIKNLECQMTLVGGKIVYRNPGASLVISKSH